MSESAFKLELAALLNRHSCENGSNTPDFILAEYLFDCLMSFEASIRQREQWYGREIGNAVAALTEAGEQPKRNTLDVARKIAEAISKAWPYGYSHRDHFPKAVEIIVAALTEAGEQTDEKAQV